MIGREGEEGSVYAGTGDGMMICKSRNIFEVAFTESGFNEWRI